MNHVLKIVLVHIAPKPISQTHCPNFIFVQNPSNSSWFNCARTVLFFQIASQTQKYTMVKFESCSSTVCVQTISFFTWYCVTFRQYSIAEQTFGIGFKTLSDWRFLLPLVWVWDWELCESALSHYRQKVEHQFEAGTVRGKCSTKRERDTELLLIHIENHWFPIQYFILKPDQFWIFRTTSTNSYTTLIYI